MKKLILSVALINLLAACSSPAPKEPVSEPKSSESAGAASDTDAAARARADEARKQSDADAAARAKADAAAALEKKSVYFPFDVDAVQADDKETILAHAKNLAANSQLKVRVEGHADERGSSEYNLALGQRRAKNTKKALVMGGAKADQIDTVSYGEEKPAASGHEEAAWAQNRRADINYNAAN